MAITKTHPIKSTLRKALNYILNPEKTDETLLVSSFACSPETADIEFEWTREQSNERGTHLARHLIQSFKPGETTPEQAHEIGMKLTEEILGGKYEFVLSTHTDKGHVHNHLIFNAVNFVDYKKYHSNKRTYHFIRRTSDRICREYGLSVIEPNRNKGKSYIEYAADKGGGSWKSQLRQTVDKAIRRSRDFDDFILHMEIAGYTVKQQNKNISFCNSEREKFMRSKTLGENYTVEAIKRRIAEQRSKPKIERKGISLLIDIQDSIKAQESKGYEHWAKINNLKQASKTINFLTEHGITTYDELENKIAEIQNSFDDAAAKLKTVEKQLSDVSVLRKHLRTYQTLRPVYVEYKKAKNKPEFEKQHRRELTLYNASHKYLSDIQNGGELPSLGKVNTDFTELSDRKRSLYEKYKKEKKTLSEMDIIKSNVDMIVGKTQYIGRDKETKIE
ncbi:MAG: relaxase/mobilization nuclease domain-containing protein [Hominilimicola sp.]